MMMIIKRKPMFETIFKGIAYLLGLSLIFSAFRSVLSKKEEKQVGFIPAEGGEIYNIHITEGTRCIIFKKRGSTKEMLNLCKRAGLDSKQREYSFPENSINFADGLYFKEDCQKPTLFLDVTKWVKQSVQFVPSEACSNALTVEELRVK